MNNKQKRIDEFLDSALADYSNVEPRAGIENRIIARLSAEEASPAPRAWLRWWPAFGFVAAALIVLVVWIGMSAPQKRDLDVVVKETPRAIQQVQPQPAPKKMATAGGSHAWRPRPTHTHVALEPAKLAVVKQDVFPAPSPLTDQERMLLAYLRKTPTAEIAANAKPDDDSLVNQQLNEVLPLQKGFESNTNTR